MMLPFKYRYFFLQRRITDIDLKKKTIELCFRQTISSLLLHRVLSGQNKKRRLHMISVSIYCHLSFFHYFKQSSLRFCRSTVYLIDQNNIAENRPGLKLKSSFSRIKNGSTQYIRWHQVRRKLYP